MWDKSTRTLDWLDSFRTLLDGKDEPIVDNFRPPQPINDRHLFFYKGKPGDGIQTPYNPIRPGRPYVPPTRPGAGSNNQKYS